MNRLRQWWRAITWQDRAERVRAVAAEIHDEAWAHAAAHKDCSPECPIVKGQFARIMWAWSGNDRLAKSF